MCMLLFIQSATYLDCNLPLSKFGKKMKNSQIEGSRGNFLQKFNISVKFILNVQKLRVNGTKLPPCVTERLKSPSPLNIGLILQFSHDNYILLH